MCTEIQITDENRAEIMAGRMCPYCGGKTEFINSRLLYNGKDNGKDYGMAYRCDPCGAWVGCHKGTSTSLGRLANGELRELKKEGHRWFDPIWRKLINNGYHKPSARAKTYKWLAQEMGIPESQCHFGMFNVDQCKVAIVICKQYYTTSIKKMKKAI